MMDISQLKSMILLLEDPDELVFQQIKNNIFENAELIRPYLDEFRTLSTDGLFQVRLQNISDQIDTMSSLTQIENWVNRIEPNLIDAIVIIQDAVFPEYDPINTLNEFKKLKQKIWIELSKSQTAIEQIKIINQYLYHNFGLRSLNPESISINQLCFHNIFQDKQANNLMQAIFYAALTQSLDLPVFPVILPDMFVLAYKNRAIAELSFANEQHYDVVFYINPYEEGKLFSKTLIEKYLESKDIEPKDFYFAPVENIASVLIYLRLLLKTIEIDNKEDYRIGMIKQMIKILSEKVEKSK
ncbi:MAG: hypothetical protein GX879_00600 [Bacteroidales bacterium]|nr:hypothetical protein [Bacteroidales bacterium]